ncbi:NAD(P)-dependent dehydrogenase [Phanerochaete sordida]|uniref:NAD(P)-dependent dehydrogenase n=1 Tax=Phanerochaete sordida TaxID=48140 RepID=A0A9P3G3P5_9APHY|nr:NAD(P)-dependent dehydrogenase [Phanerochaete sordida]
MAASFRLENLYDLKGRIAVVTGGGTGIGWMITQGLAANGAKVYITGRRKDVLEKTAASFEKTEGSGEVIPLVMDVTDRESIAAVQKELQTREGKLHILVNNAGQSGPVSKFFNDMTAPEHQSAETLGQAMFKNESFEAWAELYSINSSSIFFVTMAFLGLLAKGSEDRANYTSCVVNITSISGLWKLAQNHFCYNSAKAAATHLTKMLATELAVKKIPVRVCGVAPGVYGTEMTIDRLKRDGVDKVALGLQPVPAQRAGSAEEIAGAVIFLVSPAGNYTNGHEIVVDGGALAVNPSLT